MEKAVELDARGSRVVARRDHLHRRAYKNVVKMTFAKSASLKDRSGLLNSSLEGNTRRAIDFHAFDRLESEAEAGSLDEPGFAAAISSGLSSKGFIIVRPWESWARNVEPVSQKLQV